MKDTFSVSNSFYAILMILLISNLDMSNGLRQNITKRPIPMSNMTRWKEIKPLHWSGDGKNWKSCLIPKNSSTQMKLKVNLIKLKFWTEYKCSVIKFNVAELSKPKSRRNVSTETLRGIEEVFKRTEEEKRRLELESQLYKRWRPGSREENILLSSRSNNEALAKMNWLDKQVN